MTARKRDTRKDWESRTNETRQTKTRRQVTGTAVPDSRSSKLESVSKYLNVLQEATFHLEPESKPESPKLWVQVCAKSSAGKDWLGVVPSERVSFRDRTQPQNSSTNSRRVLNTNLAL